MNNPPDPQLDYLRVPPHSVEAEQSVLGGLLLDNSAWERISDTVGEADFYRYDHRLIWQHINRLINLSRPADVVTVHESISSAGKSEEVGGLSYLNALAHNTPSAANIRRYAEIVRERSMLRKLVSVADEISAEAFNPLGKDDGSGAEAQGIHQPGLQPGEGRGGGDGGGEGHQDSCWMRPRPRYSRLPKKVLAQPPVFE